MAKQEELPDILTPSDRPATASGCPVEWERWFAELSTWANAASVHRTTESGVRLTALGPLVHVHAVVDWDGKSAVDVGVPCAEDSAFLVAGRSSTGIGRMDAGASGIIVSGVAAGRIIVSGWYPAFVGD